MLSLILSVSIASATPPCSWNNPGANRYTGDQVTALNDYEMDPAVRARLQQRMKLHSFDEIVDITRDDIKGAKGGTYQNLHDMHYAHDKTCRGGVDRSQWKPEVKQQGLVYCDGETCVVVPSICGNVALLDRKPDEGPIDISPAAGPAPGSFIAGVTPDTVAITPALDTPYIPVVVASAPPVDMPGGGGSTYPPIYGGGGGSGGGGGGGEVIPPVKPPVTPPSGPVGPPGPPIVVPPIVVPPIVTPPVIPAVPEPGELYTGLLGLLFVGLAFKTRKR